MQTLYRFGTALSFSYEEALPTVKAALQAEGFGGFCQKSNGCDSP
jgi:hypothetical protein